jgi:GNAT superfamily N-acetyltransferase
VLAEGKPRRSGATMPHVPGEPPSEPSLAPNPAGIWFRRPRESDYEPIIGVVDEWWAGRHVALLLPRLWLQHFNGTSWLAETVDAGLAGFLIGFLSPDQPEVAYCHMLAVNPNLRRHGIGRALYERFFAEARAAGRSRVIAVTWPANRASLRFHEALGFQLVRGPDTQNLYGSPAFAEYDFGSEERTVMVRRL